MRSRITPRVPSPYPSPTATPSPDPSEREPRPAPRAPSVLSIVSTAPAPTAAGDARRRGCCSARGSRRWAGVEGYDSCGSVGIARHPVERQRREVVGARRVQVHLLAEAVAVEQEGPRPAVGQRRQRGWRRTTAQSRRPAARRRSSRRSRAAARARRPRACSGPAAASMATSPDTRVVVVAERLASVGRDLGREAAPAQVGAHRLEPASSAASTLLVRRRRPRSDPSRSSSSSRCGRRWRRAETCRSRSTGTVCGRPTGKPMSPITVRQPPGPSCDLQRSAASSSGRAGARRRCRRRTRSRSSRSSRSSGGRPAAAGGSVSVEAVFGAA